MKVKIDKRKKMPNAKRGGGATVYPWVDMAVGDSFFVNKHRSYAANIACGRSRADGRKYSVRQEGEGARIWRVK